LATQHSPTPLTQPAAALAHAPVNAFLRVPTPQSDGAHDGGGAGEREGDADAEAEEMSGVADTDVDVEREGGAEAVAEAVGNPGQLDTTMRPVMDACAEHW
jgi:hypothetical protein